MNGEVSDFLLITPEIFLLVMTCVVLMVTAFMEEKAGEICYALTQVALVGCAVLVYGVSGDTTQVAFSGHYVRDTVATVLKISLCLAGLAVFLYSRDYIKERSLDKGEYYCLGLFGVLGSMVMASAQSMLTVYLGLELLSLSMYALVAFNRDSKVATEAAMKYFVLGALASGILLYGMSIIYGVTGNIELGAIANQIKDLNTNNTALIFGVVFIIVGVAFKLGAVPFHMWLPDVYEGSPSSVTLYIGSIPKIAAFALVVRLLVDALGQVHGEWQGMLVILAVLSISAGNVIAVAQSNIKRMLAYSTISHVGFLLLGIIAGAGGYAAAMFYTLAYVLMATAAFGVIVLLSKNGVEAENLSDYKGLSERNPFYALVLLIVMFSMAGVPPTVGFYAKLAVLIAVVDAGLVWLAAVAVLFSVIGAFYYIRIIKLMYFDKSDGSGSSSGIVTDTLDTRLVIGANGLAVLLLGLYPAALMSLCSSAFA